VSHTPPSEPSRLQHPGASAPRRPLLALLALAGILGACKQPAPLPFVGDCAVYPDGVYEFGEIGIGTCLSGSTELMFTDDADGEPVLLVTNANTYQNFTGGSLLAIPWSGIDLSVTRNEVHNTGAAAVGLPDFAGGLGVRGDLAMVAVRLSEGARVRQHWDDVWLVDLTDPLAPKLASRGTNGGNTVKVQSDPNDVEVDPTSGYTYVANRTTHSVSILDGSGDTVSVVRPWPEAVMTAAEFDDADNSGSRAALTDMEVLEDSFVSDDNWSLDWISGTWRVWSEADGGVLRVQDVGDHDWTPTAIGLEMTFAEAYSTIDRVADPEFTVLGTMYFASDGAIRAARSIGNAAGFWRYMGFALLTPSETGWDDGELGGPGVLAEDGGITLFYDATSTDLTTARSIGSAWSPDGLAFERGESPVLEPELDWEAGGIADPAPVLDPENGELIVYYSAFDGTAWRIGRASSFDRLNWTRELLPILDGDGDDVAAPVVSASVGRWRMVYSKRSLDTGLWETWEAESADGLSWTEVGLVTELDEVVATQSEPPGAALSGLAENRFRAYGEYAGNLAVPIVPGVSFLAANYGWVARPVSGFLVDAGDAGAESEGGVRVSSFDKDAGLAWLSIQSAGNVPRVGIATIDDDLQLDVEAGAIFSGSSGFDRDGADMPVVQWFNGEYHMFYRAHRGRSTSIGHATSPDGRSWTRQGRVIAPGNDWDRRRVEPGGIEVLADGRLRLWFAGTDGELWRIGSATTSDGTTFSRETASSRGYVFPPGVPGDWDDSGVRHPFAMRGVDDEGRSGTHLWYSGFDGATWRGGYAFRPDETDLFERAEDEVTGIARPVLLAGGGQFSTDGALRPVLAESDVGWHGFYGGRTSSTDRVGGISGASPDALHRVLAMPTVGDALTFSTERGDPDALAIPLDLTLPNGIALSGLGLTGLTVDSERGWLYAASKLTSYFYIIDIRDDSSGTFRDLNYLDVEAIVSIPSGAIDAGFRKIVADPSGDRLYALQDDPEAIVVVDISGIEDNGGAELVSDVAVGFLPARRGMARDEGVFTLTDVGPSSMVLHPDGYRMFVANYNGNSVSVYDLDIGTWGQQVGEVGMVGEGPSGMVLTPDGKHLVVANLAGEVSNEGLAQSTLAVIDVDETSPTYLEVRTWVTNQ